MDSTPIPNPNPSSASHQHLPLQPSPRKLPIKRKNHIPGLNLTPKLEPTTPANADAEGDSSSDGDDGDSRRKPPPFKFHRIWTETDEVRFLHGLLNCSSDGLSFPRDLQFFYSRFSRSMSQPYSRSQLSEKLRRLRKKFRVISSRIARGLDPAKLSPHDRELFELSIKLWHPDHASSSPFMNSNDSKKKVKHMHNNLVGVKISFSPTLPLPSNASSRSHNNNDRSSNDPSNVVNNADIDCYNDDGGGGGSGSRVGGDGGDEVNVGNDNCVDINVSEMYFDANLGGGGEEEELCRANSLGSGLGRVAARTVIDVFDQSLKEVRMVLVREGLLDLDLDHETRSNDYFKRGKSVDFEKRWREQQVVEFDVLARRLSSELNSVWTNCLLF